MKELLEEVRTNENGIRNVEIEVQNDGKILIPDAIFVRFEGNLVKVKYDDILWLKGDGNYTTLVARHSVFSVRNILKDFEIALPSDRFMRIHKSYIVQISEINAINTKEIKVATDLVPVGRTYYHDLVNGIQKLGSHPD
ncbi:MAG: LytTR family DNA-binding domain-containing protein [Algoriphagus sp.]|uniref:LytR/AlgR family response regulator transcription factor n=1 Tax=Algoriphagus sp. TaxID=1872435 RepID=UPI00272775C3|nr:LytTR family DNA-binding domain-containing protein [Algoriphagus sp.]MDO8967561.1 LytTR family DNA-binding domain-containing protein [Algoriphagus sp.]MDP2042268.1 LytTR family DNA-binding domain-containing protein [Algoriphagus sp.]MDP3198201.1 LytTR family DNA-binding domain-containing protein [Algoriphagus sp.]MDP3471438.1 LytTR family DNA-binding domain-containing protein [Algoriphagus sp.]